MPDLYEINLAGGHYNLFLDVKRREEGEEGVKRLVNQYAEPILIHYIECDDRYCYTARFRDMIRPYFDEPSVLDKVLRSSIIKEQWRNVMTGITGAKIFPALLHQLKQCKSESIREYLADEFPDL